MKKRVSSAGPGLFFAVSLCFAAAWTAQAQENGKLLVIELTGTPHEMGLIHGRALKPEINELIKRWKEDLSRTYKVSADIYIRKLLDQTDFRPSIDRWTPGLLDEVRGIAEGAGVDFETMFAFQLIDEIWTVSRDLDFQKCTSIGAGRRASFPAFTSQTQDIPGFYHGYPTLLRIRDRETSLETLVFTIPGVIALNGMNSRAVGVCVNAVTQLAHSREGLPVAFVIRGILRQKTFKDAERFLRDIPPAAPQNYVLGGPDEAACYERSAARIVRFLPFEGAEFTYHTNHPLINDDLDAAFAARLKNAGMAWADLKNKCPRFNFLERALKDNSAVIDLAVLKSLYADRSSGINNPDTYGCTIMVLGEKPELHISPGRPDEEPFRVFRFSVPADRR
jgi:isopenicillin-N N-acyltransferase like protein